MGKCIFGPENFALPHPPCRKPPTRVSSVVVYHWQANYLFQVRRFLSRVFIIILFQCRFFTLSRCDDVRNVSSLNITWYYLVVVASKRSILHPFLIDDQLIANFRLLLLGTSIFQSGLRNLH